MRERLSWALARWNIPSIPQYRRELHRFADGGLCALDYLPAAPVGRSFSAPTVVILPGVTGDSTDLRVASVAKATAAAGCRAIVHNRRGHGGVGLVTPKFNIFGDAADLHHVLLAVHRTAPNSPIVLVGLSAGSALCIRYLGDVGSGRWPDAQSQALASCLRAGIAISPGYELSVW